MPRIARKDLETSFLHLMVQGVNKEYIFYKKEYIEKYLKMFMENKEKHNFTIIAYCIMNNHAHFLVYAEDKKELGKAMHKTNFSYAQMFNRKENRVGVLFRNRYEIEPIYDMKHLINCINYIHNNPVKAKMVLKCENYKYSTYKDYINNVGVTKSKIMKEMFGEKCNYLEIFSKSYDKRFMDIEESEEDTNRHIIEGIREYKNEYNKKICEILSSKGEFKSMISFLKEKCGIKYVELIKYFEMSTGVMEGLKIK